VAILASDLSAKGGAQALSIFDVNSRQRKGVLSSAELRTLISQTEGAHRPMDDEGSPTVLQVSWSPGGDALLLAGSRWLIWFDLLNHRAQTLVTGSSLILDPKVSPTSSYVAFIREHRLWTVRVNDSAIEPLTLVAEPARWQGELPSVYTHGFQNLKTGYWWAPNGLTVAFLEANMEANSPFLAPEARLDTSREVDVRERFVTTSSVPSMRLMLAEVSSRSETPKLLDTAGDGKMYLPRATWLPDSNSLAVEHLNPNQTELEMVLIDTKTGSSHPILTEKDEYWINLNEGPRFLKDGDRFLWTSERSGFNHLYLCQTSGGEQRALTHGNWEVRHTLGVDERTGTAYVTGGESNPTENQLYAVDLQHGDLTRVTDEAGWHEPDIAPGGNAFLDRFSDALTPPHIDLVGLHEKERIMLVPPSPAPVSDLEKPEFLVLKTHDDVDLQAMMLRPPGFDPHRKYPMLIEAGGGPGEQNVRNRWDGSLSLWRQLMAQKGFIVLAFDPRGSGGYGHLFEEPIHYWLGGQEKGDERDAVIYLQKFPYIDTSRIGIWGTHYGGQLAIGAVLNNPRQFRAAYAEAPITDWLIYNPIFGQRYLGDQRGHQEEYRKSSVIDDADKLKGQIFVSAPVQSDLTYFHNAVRLQEVLAKAGKFPPFEIFAGDSEAEREQASIRCLLTRVTSFFEDTLQPEQSQEHKAH
jgi:dipeptidyl-peptidase 4